MDICEKNNNMEKSVSAANTNTNGNNDEVLYSGYLRKKGGRVNSWGERFFVLKGNTLYYYLKANDTVPRGFFPLQVTTQISSISTDSNRKKKQYVFKLSWPVDDDDGNQDIHDDNQRTSDRNQKLTRKRSEDKKHSSATATAGKVAAIAVGGVVVGALTAGVGLVAGLLVVGVGAAASGGAVVLEQATAGDVQHREKVVVLACDSYHEAEAWINAFEARLFELGDHTLGLPLFNSNINRAICRKMRSHTPHPAVRLEYVEEWINSSKWKIYDVYEGVRLLQITHNDSANAVTHDKSNNQIPTACMRVNLEISASASDTFSAIMNFSPSLRTGIIRSIRIVQNIDNFTDIVHIKMEPIFLYPTWTAPRDFCLVRYWRDNFDGSYVICLDSTEHPECPIVDGFVRGAMHAVYLVSPPKPKMNSNLDTASAVGKDNDDEEDECMLTLIAHIDPKGWIWSSPMFGYNNLFLKEFMLHILDIRDALDSERFLQVQFDPIGEGKKVTPKNQNIEDADSDEIQVASIPPPILDRKYWMDTDASTFRVRGSTYMSDKVKVRSAAPALFKLLCIDVFETTAAQHNICSHPSNRVLLSKQRGEDVWVFALNIMVPGTPYYNFVSYFQGDKSLIEEDTPFGRIARPFFNGNDDEFRNSRFKLIPKIVDGNMMIKMAVKDTPTLLGNKLKQYYYKGDNYFEIDVDVGSSSVARNICGLAIGYSKAIVVDMGFCLQGNEESELPEVLMGCVSCYHVDMTTGKKLVS